MWGWGSVIADEFDLNKISVEMIGENEEPIIVIEKQLL